MEVGKRIREERDKLGLSQEDLARRIFVSRQTVSNWETGKTYPDVQSLLLLSNLFGASVDSLVKGDVEAMQEKMEN
jgi:transcriptional regulator with XRE-family HTH domain